MKKCNFSKLIERTTKRSFREFCYLYADLKWNYQKETLPIFPQKKKQNSYLSRKEIEDRKNLLDLFLRQMICKHNSD